ncbi:unnamed protein product [Arctogadus glacialis]
MCRGEDINSELTAESVHEHRLGQRMESKPNADDSGAVAKAMASAEGKHKEPLMAVGAVWEGEPVCSSLGGLSRAALCVRMRGVRRLHGPNADEDMIS